MNCQYPITSFRGARTTSLEAHHIGEILEQIVRLLEGETSEHLIQHLDSNVKNIISQIRERDITLPPGLHWAIYSCSNALSENSGLDLYFGIFIRNYVLNRDIFKGKTSYIDAITRNFAGLILDILRGLRPLDYVVAAELVYDELGVFISSTNREDINARHRIVSKYYCRMAITLAFLNSPHCYPLISKFLRHEWHEVRDRAAFWFRHWSAPTLSEDLVSALKMGTEDLVSEESCRHIFKLLSVRGNRQAIYQLESLKDTSVAGKLLSDTILELRNRVGAG